MRLTPTMCEHNGRDPVPPLLVCVEGLRVAFGPDEAVRGVDFLVASGRVLCLVDEPGCGKSVTARAVMRLIEPAGRVTAGGILWPGSRGSEAMDLAALDPSGRDRRPLRGPGMAMIFQEPMSTLSPVHTIGEQLTEAMRLHLGLSRRRPRAVPSTSSRVLAFPIPAPASRPTHSSSRAGCASAR